MKRKKKTTTKQNKYFTGRALKVLQSVQTRDLRLGDTKMCGLQHQGLLRWSVIKMLLKRGSPDVGVLI